MVDVSVFPYNSSAEIISFDYLYQAENYYFSQKEIVKKFNLSKERYVNLTNTALKKAIVEFYPEILKYKLCDYKVRILDSKDGTAATVRVNVETTDGTNKWDTVGVSEDIIEASYMAITDSIMYGLILHNPDCME